MGKRSATRQSWALVVGGATLTHPTNRQTSMIGQELTAVEQAPGNVLEPKRPLEGLRPGQLGKPGRGLGGARETSQGTEIQIGHDLIIVLAVPDQPVEPAAAGGDLAV